RRPHAVGGEAVPLDRHDRPALDLAGTRVDPGLLERLVVLAARERETRQEGNGEEGAHRHARSLHHLLALQGPPHLVERLLLELTDPLARQVVLLADLLERHLLIVVETEAL